MPNSAKAHIRRAAYFSLASTLLRMFDKKR